VTEQLHLRFGDDWQLGDGKRMAPLMLGAKFSYLRVRVGAVWRGRTRQVQDKCRTKTSAWIESILHHISEMQRWSRHRPGIAERLTFSKSEAVVACLLAG
jgi:hypothetical protein